MLEITISGIYEAIFFAGIILIVFSIPKLVYGLIWLRYNLWLYGNLGKLFEGEKIGPILNRLIKADTIKEMAINQDFVLKTKLEKLGEFVKFSKAPLVEAISGLMIIGLLSVFFIDYDILTLALFIVMVILLGFIILYSLIMVWRVAFIHIGVAQGENKKEENTQ